jgi:hypothetical protein
MYALRLTLVAFVLASLALIQGSTAVAASGYTLFGDATFVGGGHPGTAVQLRSAGPLPSPTFGGIDFATASGMTVSDLNNLSTDYKFTAGSCGGGAPRFQINVTNGTVSGNIFVYIGPPPNYTGCAMNMWLNTTNLVAPANLVDATQLGGAFYEPWAAVLVAYGTYAVTGIQLVTDGGWAVTGLTQTVLVDNVMINSTTYTFEDNAKESCKNGGWQDFTSSPGPFRNEGDCVSFFARGG